MGVILNRPELWGRWFGRNQLRSKLGKECVMGKIAESWRDVRNRSAVQEFGGADRVGVPEVSELLCGKPNAVGTGWERPPLSLLLYLEGESVKFCFSAKEFPMQLWGCVPSFKDVIEHIEDALCKERCDWKKKREDDNGYAHRSR